MPVPSAPTNVTLGNVFVTRLGLSWTDPNTPDVEIRTYYRLSSEVTWTMDATLPAGTTSYTFGEITPLLPGTEYDIGVSAWDDPDESAIVSVTSFTIDGVSFVSGGSTLMFKPGNIQIITVPDIGRQRRLVSSDGTVRVREISGTDDRFLDVTVVALPRQDSSPFSGYDSLRTFLLTTVNWAENSFTLHDNDGDSYTVRLWSDPLNFDEMKLDEYEGRLLMRVAA